MDSQQLIQAGFSENEVSQYSKLRGAGFSDDEIGKHISGGLQTPAISIPTNLHRLPLPFPVMGPPAPETVEPPTDGIREKYSDYSSLKSGEFDPWLGHPSFGQAQRTRDLQARRKAKGEQIKTGEPALWAGPTPAEETIREIGKAFTPFGRVLAGAMKFGEKGFLLAQELAEGKMPKELQ